jgi:membrane protein YqaA with SNARE-associated domain
LKAIKTLLAKYTAFFLKMLSVLGIWGAFVIPAVDSAAFGIPLDPVMVGYALMYANRGQYWMIAFAIVLASAGSAVGSLVPYWIGRKGGEPLLLKKISHARLEQLRDRYESWEFFSIMVPAMLPPPTPMKLIILAAGAFEMRPLLFSLAIFIGRALRFSILSWVVVKYGPGMVRVIAFVIRQHLPWVLISLAIMIALIFLVRSQMKSSKRP